MNGWMDGWQKKKKKKKNRELRMTDLKERKNMNGWMDG